MYFSPTATSPILIQLIPFTSSVKNFSIGLGEALQHITTDLTYVSQDNLNADEDIINFQNGLLKVTATDVELMPHSAEALAKLQSRFICLQYEFQYNLDKISNLDYEHRYRNPEYITYQSNVSRIMDESSYINQWTAELAKLGLFQKDLKKM